VNRAQEKLFILREVFCKLDVCRKSVVLLALSYNYHKIVVRYFVN